MVQTSVSGASRRFARILALAVGTLLLLTEPGVLDVATAHEFEAASTLSLSASKRKIRKGKRVTLFGKVGSAEVTCLEGRLVTVFRVGGGAVGKVLSGADGSYSIRIKPRRTAKYQSRIDTRTEGVHPHRHVCLGATSNIVRVKVKKRR